MDIHQHIVKAVVASKIKDGICIVFNPHTTGQSPLTKGLSLLLPGEG